MGYEMNDLSETRSPSSVGDNLKAVWELGEGSGSHWRVDLFVRTDP
jgi:hypothetical protein